MSGCRVQEGARSLVKMWRTKMGEPLVSNAVNSYKFVSTRMDLVFGPIHYLENNIRKDLTFFSKGVWYYQQIRSVGRWL